MAETDLTIKPSNNITQPTSAIGIVDSAEVEERIINIQIVEGVLNGDYPSSDFQVAKKTWELLVEAGMEPGTLVANGLHEGHNYFLRKVFLKQPFKKRVVVSLMGETKATDEGLVSYYLEIIQNRSESNLISESNSTRTLVKRLLGLERLFAGTEVIESTVILPLNSQKISKRPSLVALTKDSE